MKVYLCDNHLPGFDEITFDDFSIEQWERNLVNGRVDCLMLYAKDHWGWSYYNTEAGQRHPKLDFDLFSAFVEILRKNNIKLMTYYSIGFDNLMAATRNDWALRKADGEKYRIWREKYPKWHSCCFNTGYRDYCKAQIREILTMHRADFLFLDIVKHGGYTGFGSDNLPLCYCQSCRDKFSNRYGMEIPETTADLQKQRRIIQDWEMNVLDYEVVDEITALAESIQPAIPVMFNETVHFAQRTRQRMNAHFSEGRYGSWRTAAISRVQQPPKNYTRSIISCHPTITAYDPGSVAESALAAAQVAAWNGDPFLMHGPQDANGKLDEMSVNDLSKAFAPLQQLTPLLDERTPAGEVWIMESDRQRMLDPADHSKPVLLLIDYLTYSNYSFAVVRENDLDLLDQSEAKALIIPRATWLTEPETESIRQFVHNGGLLVCSEDISLGQGDGTEPVPGANFLLADVIGVDFIKVNHTYADNPWGSYIVPADHPIWNGTEIARTTVPLLPPLYEVSLHDRAEQIARHLLPSVPMQMDRWVNWFPPPPGKQIAPTPAVVLNRFGNGVSLYFSASYLDSSRPGVNSGPLSWPKKWFTHLLETVLPQPHIRLISDYPEYIDATYYRREKELIVHCINTSVENSGGSGIPIKAGKLTINNDFAKAVFAKLLPSGRKLDIQTHADNQVIDVPEIMIHEIVHIQLESEQQNEKHTRNNARRI